MLKFMGTYNIRAGLYTPIFWGTAEYNLSLLFSYYRVNTVPAFWWYLETLSRVRAQAGLTFSFMKQGFWASNLVSQFFHLLWGTLEIV